MKIIDNEGGYTLIPELASLEVNNEQVKRFSSMTPLREVSLVYTRKYAKTQMLQAITETIKSVVPQQMLDPKRGKTVEWK
jgi:LysR family hydrogen peroxide-inducible transcriptional activator